MPLHLVRQNKYRQSCLFGPAHHGGRIAIEVLRNNPPGIEPVVTFRHLVPPS